MVRKVLILVLLLCRIAVFAQERAVKEDSIKMSTDTTLYDANANYSELTGIDTDSLKTDNKVVAGCNGIYKFKPLQLIIPAAMIGVGVVGLESHWIIRGNHEVREELQESGHGKFTIDDFTQFAPTVAVYGLNLCGVKGAHDFGERTIILGTAALLNLSAVYAIKATSNVQRPDGSAYNSFPSGHTAMAFMGAEFLRREYWNVSPWIGVAGYAVAAGTGFLRMYNNRHWATDVLAGAGIGILSTEIAYWIFPYVSKLFYPSRRKGRNVAVAPFISADAKGLACQITF